MYRVREDEESFSNLALSQVDIKHAQPAGQKWDIHIELIHIGSEDEETTTEREMTRFLSNMIGCIGLFFIIFGLPTISYGSPIGREKHALRFLTPAAFSTFPASKNRNERAWKMGRDLCE